MARAFSDLGNNCAGLGPDSVCYGFAQVSATLSGDQQPPADFFAQPGYQTDLASIESVATGALAPDAGEWGIAVMNLQADTPSASTTQSTVYLMLGDVQITNLVEAPDRPGRGQARTAPMQEFTLRTDDAGMAACLDAPPSVLVVQSPDRFPVTITVNGVPVELESTVILRAPAEDQLQVMTGNGGATLFPDAPNQVAVPAGVSVDVTIGDEVIEWTNWRVMSQAEWDRYAALENVPQNILRAGYANPSIIIPSAVGQPPPQVQLPGGITRPIPPRGRPFPLIAMHTGRPGRALERDPWQPVTVGAEVCSDWTLFQSNRNNNWDVLRLDFGGGITNVSQSLQSADIEPTFSPDGEWVAFTTNRDPVGSWEIYLARNDGSDQQRLTYNTAIDVNPVWGPGSLVVFESNRDRNWELYMIDVAGDGEPVRLTDDPGNDLGAFWYPDGEHIVFESDRDGDWELYQLNVLTGDLVQLTDNDTRDRQPIVSHDGSTLAWLQTDEDGIENLWLMDTATNATSQLTALDTDVKGAVFSPDDSLIAYYAQDDLQGDHEVYVVEVETGQISALTDNAVHDTAPTFYCQTSAVIYQSVVDDTPGRPGQYDLFMVDPLPLGSPGTPARLTAEADADDVFAVSDPRTEANTRPNLILPGPLQ